MSALTCWLSLRKRQNPSSMYTTAWRRERHSRSCWAEADLRRWYSLPKMANRSFLVMCCDNSPYCCFQTAKLMLLIQKKEKMNVFVKPDEQRPSLLGLCHGEETKAQPTFLLSQMSRDQACLGYAMARKRGRSQRF